MTLVTAVVLAMHVLSAAVWFGAMAYSLGVVQPRVEQALGERSEDLLVLLGSGARWKVVGVIGVLAVTGACLVLLAPWPGSSYTWREVMRDTLLRH